MTWSSARKTDTVIVCGHDSHAAMLLGAARILKEMEDELEGTVKLMFQPGEETGAGARVLVETEHWKIRGRTPPLVFMCSPWILPVGWGMLWE